MAYSFWAEKRGSYDLRVLRDRLRESNSIEFFPVDVSEESIVIGISVPLNGMNEKRFECDVEGAIHFLMSDAGFVVFDLFTGNEIALAEVPGLAQRILG